MLTISSKGRLRFLDEETNEPYITNKEEILQMLKIKQEMENQGYRTIDDEGNLINPFRFNNLDVITEETGEFICDLVLTDEHVEKLIGEGIKEILKRQISTNPLRIEKIILNDPATIVWFDDGDKVVVKATDDDRYDPDIGVAMAVVKKAFGSRTAYRKFVQQWMTEADKFESQVKEIIYRIGKMGL